MSVIQRSWVNPEQEYVQIHFDLVEEVGSWELAAIVARMAFRTNPLSREAIEIDGVLWWRAKLEALGDELKFKRSKMQRLMEQLVESGTLIRERHHLGTANTWDRTYSYRINYAEVPTSAESRISQIREMENPDLGNVHNPDLGNVPLVKNLKNSPQPPKGDGVEFEHEEHRLFDMLMDSYPRKDDRDAALMEWYRVIRKGKATPSSLLAAARTFAKHVTQTGVPMDKVKTLPNWLRAGSYDNRLPDTTPTNPYRRLTQEPRK